MKRVLFVCMGNICRSPTAEGVLRQIARARRVEDAVEIDSAGTGNWHVGSPPDHRAQEAASRRGIDLSGLRARQVGIGDMEYYDLIVAMDRRNRSHLVSMAQPRHRHKIRFLLEFSEQYEQEEVPDPYYGGDHAFDLVLDMIEESCERLLDTIAGQ